jgi:hypothetical protein
MPLEDDGNLHVYITTHHKRIVLQIGGIQIFLYELFLMGQKQVALIHYQKKQVVPQDHIQEVPLILPVRQKSSNLILLGGIFRHTRGDQQNAPAEQAVHNGPEAAVLIGKIIVERLPGKIQLTAQVGNTDRGIGPLEQIVIETVLDLLLPPIGIGRTGNM